MSINLQNIDIYFSRFTSAICLFLVLAAANVWLDPLNNTILVLGYRLFILLTPLLFLLFKHRLTLITFVLVEIGLFLWLLNYTLWGTVLFAIGISVSGYMLKYYSAFSAHGAAGNKIAINMGSIFSGIIIMISLHMGYLVLFSAIIMLLSLTTFTFYYNRVNIPQFPHSPKQFQLRSVFTLSGLAWGLIGFVIGVKLIAIVSVLPQFLMAANDGDLPHWFGLLLIINSIMIVLLQMPIINKIKSWSAIYGILPLFAGMLIIMLSKYLGIVSFIGALLWTTLLSIVECTISYLDKLAQDDHALLIKEACVGIGSASTVYFVRFFNPEFGAFMIGTISIVLLFTGIVLLHLNKKCLICVEEDNL